MQQVQRFQYRAQLTAEPGAELDKAVQAAQANADALVKEGKLLTAGLFRFEKQIFTYYETIDCDLTPADVYPSITELLIDWPGARTPHKWHRMGLAFYHAKPEGLEDWKRKTAPEKRLGRLAYLKPELAPNYLYYHIAIAREGMLPGDKYAAIAIDGDCLFSYMELPMTPCNVQRNLDLKSEVIDAWQAENPNNIHFDFWPGPQGGCFAPIETLAMSYAE